MNGNNVSVLIITANEELCVGKAIASVNWSNDIVIVDSFSTDKTKEIATGYRQVRFFENSFKDYSSQRNFGLHEIEYRNPLVFLLDADEVCTPELGEELTLGATKGFFNKSVYLIRRKDFFMGKWMRCNHPTWCERLVRPKEVAFSGVVHEHLSYSGNSTLCRGFIHHYPFSHGIDHWIARHNRYTTLSAPIEVSSAGKITISDLFRGNRLQRRRCIKNIFQKLPARYLFFFFFRYIIKGGFFDGIAGLHYVLLETYYHLTSSTKVRELKIKERRT